MTQDAAAPPILAIKRLTKRFGGLVATDDLSLEVAPGELHALIGPNGAGKTTVINQLMGEIAPDAGEIVFKGRNLSGLSSAARVRAGIGRTFQITQTLPDFIALDHVALAVQAHAGHSFRFFRAARSDRALREPALRWLEQVGLGPRAMVRASDLSHGERKQLELAMALAGQPALLLLDEPMAGLGASETAAMVTLLAGLKGRVTMLLVEHDMEAVFALADRISVLVYGRRIACGSATDVKADPEVRAAYLGEGDA